jgi:hypothetical protein
MFDIVLASSFDWICHAVERLASSPNYHLISRSFGLIRHGLSMIGALVQECLSYDGCFPNSTCRWMVDDVKNGFM